MMYRRIKEMRQDHDLTEKQMAEILSVSRSGYAHYENGDRSIPTDILVKMADYFDTSTDYLLNRIDFSDPPASLHKKSK